MIRLAVEIVENYYRLDPKLRAALPRRLVEAVRQIEARASEAVPPPQLVEVCRARALTIEQQRMLATALLAGPAGAQGAAMYWIARLAPIEGSVYEDANRALAWLVSQGLVEPVQRPPGVPVCRWKFRAGKELERIAAVVPGPEGRAGGWQPGAADLSVDPMQPVSHAGLRAMSALGVDLVALAGSPGGKLPAAASPPAQSNAPRGVVYLGQPGSQMGPGSYVRPSPAAGAEGAASPGPSRASAPASSPAAPAGPVAASPAPAAPASPAPASPAPVPASAAPAGRQRREMNYGVLRAPGITFNDLIIDGATRESLLDAAALAAPAAQALIRQPGLSALFGRARGTVLLFEGPPGTGKTLAAEALAHRLNLGLFVVSTERLVDPNLVKGMFEEAAGLDAVLFLDEADDVVSARGSSAHALDRSHNACVAQLLMRLESTEGVIVMATNAGHRLDPALERRLSGRVSFPLPGEAERRELWLRHLPGDLNVTGTLDVELLARKYAMSGARIRNAVVAATRRALRHDASPATFHVEASEIERAAEEQSRQAYRDKALPADGESAQIGELRHPRVTLDEVVLPADLADDLAEALVTLDPGVASLMDTPAFAGVMPAGRGVVLLFEGPPGTGKSLTAEAVAHKLGKPLYVAQSERITGMWLGQTEKAMARLFDEAEAHGAVLLLDEADDLLSARHKASSGSDRTYNRVVDIALKRIEETKGVIVLTTNMGASLDPALERRLTGRWKFELPKAPERALLLAKLVPPAMTLAPDVDLSVLARRHELSGGQLRNAMLKAMRRTLRLDLAARVITAENLEAALVAVAGESSRRIGFSKKD